MKILILGGNGFIGSNLCRILSEYEDIYSFDINEPINRYENVKYIVGDYFDEEIIKKNVRDMDVVIHAISLLNPSNSSEKYRIGYNIEIQQMMKLCEILSDNKIKLIFLSSGGTVYGEQTQQPIKENAMTCAINHYGSVKLCMENMIRAFVVQNGLDAHIARISNPYGIGQDYRKGVGFIDAVVRNVLNREVIKVWGDGGNVRDYIYIDDVCKMLYVLCKYVGKKEIFNISTGIGTSQNKIIAIVSHILGPVSVEYLPRRSIDVRKTILDNKAIMSLYGNPLVPLSDGIEKYINYMKTQ